MRVLHVIPGVAPQYGGPSKAIFDMCRELQKHGLEVEVATTDADVQGNIAMPLGCPVKVDGVTIWYFRSPLLRKYGFSPGLTQWLKECVKEYDILHIHAFFSYIPIPTAYYARKYNIPYVMRPIGHLNPWCFKRSAWKKRHFYRFLGRTILREAAAIHVTSEMEQQGLMNFGFAEKSVVIPLGVEISSSYAIPIKPNSSNHIPRILFLSRIDPKKGLPLLLQSIRLLKDRGVELALTVAGSGETSYMSKMKTLAQRLSIEREVRFSGFVLGEDKHHCLAESDVFVLPSYDENFGVAVAEAMAAGLPVIVSDRVGLAKEVEEAGAGVVIPAGSVNDLAAAILQVISNTARQREMGYRARRLAEERFTWPRAIKRLASLYRAVVEGAESPILWKEPVNNGYNT